MRNEEHKKNEKINVNSKKYGLGGSKAITLISLVITIILLIILAGIIINISLKNNGLFMKAKQARNETEKASLIEQIQTEIIDKQLQNEENEIDKKTLEDILKKYGEVKKDEEGNITGIKPDGKTEISIEDIMGNNKVTEAEKPPVISDVSGANEPSGQIANKEYVTWEWNTTTNEYDEILSPTQPDNWYDYENGKWANIKTTKVNTNEDGTKETLEAYWVWIPRYEYKITYYDDANKTTVSSNNNITTYGKIDVRFIGTDKKEGSTGYNTTIINDSKVTTSNDGYTIHPAFTWNEMQENGTYETYELPGIWVAKYEASSNVADPDSNYGGGEGTTEKELKVQVKPLVQSWRNIRVRNIFEVCRNMTNSDQVLSGSTVNSHLMKNIEWGAVAILSESRYGIYNPQSKIEDPTTGTRRIWNNPNGYNTNANIYTGYVGNEPDASTAENTTIAPTNVYPYNTANGPKGSTTGTIYGVYDMAGGSWEYTAGCLTSRESLNFGVKSGDYTYVDIYTNSNDSSKNVSGAKIGDIIKEAEGWNSDATYFVYSTFPIFAYGGRYDYGTRAGVFAYIASAGSASSYYSFRVTLVP